MKNNIILSVVFSFIAMACNNSAEKKSDTIPDSVSKVTGPANSLNKMDKELTDSISASIDSVSIARNKILESLNNCSHRQACDTVRRVELILESVETELRSGLMNLQLSRATAFRASLKSLIAEIEKSTEKLRRIVGGISIAANIAGIMESVILSPFIRGVSVPVVAPAI